MKHICSNCNRQDEVTFLRTYDYGKGGSVHVYLDSSGRRIYNGVCLACKRSVMRKNRGHSARNVSKKPSVVIAVQAERAAQRHFEKLGFEVERVDAIGPDLICRMGKFEWTVEVKRACRDSRAWRTRSVRPSRIKDDLVAIVAPNDRVYIDSMENHLRHCGKNGNRSVTGIVKELLAFDRII